jgi:trans-2,3-dihydro-3-hydroxyanthranilate isomerase
MGHRYFVADVFTDRPLEGNQVAVFVDGPDVPEALLQAVAREMRLAETVFCFPPEQGGDVRVRIFTPSIELPFAGHPVLGTAFVVGGLRSGSESIAIETGMGTVPVAVERNGDKVTFGRMEQPVPVVSSYENAEALLDALGVSGSGLPIEAYRNGPVHVYVELADEDAVRALSPDLSALERLGEHGTSCFAGSGSKWKTRMFGPALGVPEDAATGSAAGPLAVHLSRHGRINFGDQIEIRQGAEIDRPSVLYASAHGSADELERVTVGGSAVVVAEGQYNLSQ